MSINYFTEREAANFRFSRALKQAAQDDLRGSHEAELLREATERAGKTFTSNSFFLPWELLRRDLTITSGANLIATDTPFALDAMRPDSIIMQAGAQVVRVVADQTIPRVTGTSTATWLADETSQIAESQSIIGVASATPKNAGIVTDVSGQLVRQGDIDAFLTRELTRSMAQALDAVAVAGSGINGQPLGLHATPGIDAQAGANLSWADILGMLEAVETANGKAPQWFAPPAVKTLLSARERIAGGGREVWLDNTIAGQPARASTLCPAGTLTVGDFSRVQILLFGDGLDIAVDPFAGFNTGKVAYRAWLAADVVIATPAAFSVATSVS